MCATETPLGGQDERSLTAHMNTESYGWTREAPASNTYLLPAITRLLRGLRPRTLLDLGCGNGALLSGLRLTAAVRVGCDADLGGIENARSADPGAQYLHVPVNRLVDPLPGGPFDAIVSTEVVEHLYCPDDLFRAARAQSAPNGHLIVSTPYHGWLKNAAIALTGHWDSHHTALWNGGHIKFWSPKTLTALGARNGWRRVGFRGVGRLPFLWKSMILVFRLAS